MKTSRSVFGFVIALTFALVVSQTGLAWGPDRPTHTTADPANSAVFNSITDNPAYGDERNFIRLKDASLGDSAYADDTKIEPGKEYVAYIYFHNNASETYNSPQYNERGVAKDVKLRLALPATLKAGQRTGMTAYRSSSNTNPPEVYDDTFMTSTVDVNFKYISGSATIHSFGAVNGQKLPDSVITDGALLGYDSLNGVLPGCNPYAGYVIARFIAEAPNFTVQKLASPTGQKKWAENIDAKVGDTVDFRIEYKNISTTQQDNVLIQDVLPKGLEYVKGSAMIFNTAHPAGTKTDDGITERGLNTGSYAAGGNVFLRFSAKVASNLDVCGANVLVNTASAMIESGKKTDTATVTVNVECKPNECRPGIPEGDERCKDVPAVTELPSTGPRETFIVLTVLIAAVAFATYEVQKRRKARKAFAAHVAAGAPTHELLEDGRDDKHKEALFVRKDHHDVASHHDAEQQDDETPSDDHTSDEGAPEERQW